jgi:hypothetical protein
MRDSSGAPVTSGGSIVQERAVFARENE